MIIGREKEIERLTEAYESDMPQFVTVYGRRRVGKTFLIRETFKGKLLFQHSGLANSDKKQQLQAWVDSLKDAGVKITDFPKSWIDAFSLLKQLINNSKKKKKVIFIDELPWIDTQHSGFLSALEYFWNAWASARNDVMLIVCGSATSWIINKLIRNHGGLHNRVTMRINLSPFSLHECALFSDSNHLNLTQRQILEHYMVLGGIPFYWSFLEKGRSAAQNINALFAADGVLSDEFNELYYSLFRNPEPYIHIIKTLGKKRCGLTRDEIIKEAQIPDNGNLSKILADLESCGFVRKYTQIGLKVKNALYQLVDFYTLFYFYFLEDNPQPSSDFWLLCQASQQYSVWSGLAFERVCFAHLEQIKQGLGIAGVECRFYPWRSNDAQIDMVIDRNDGVINLCEIKFYKSKFAFDEAYLDKMFDKKYSFEKVTKTQKAVFLTMLTSYGITKNQYSCEIQNELTLSDLFVF